VQDPQSAVFGIYKSSRPSQSWDGTPVIGRFSWHELMTTDYVKAFEFYRKLFGWEKTGEMDMGGGNNYFMYGRGTKMYGGMFNRMPDMAGMHPFWMVYIHVPDVRKAVDIATKNGAQLHRGPMEIPGGSIAILGDPQGAGFALHDMKQSAGAGAGTSGAKKAASRSPAKKSVAKKSPAKKSAAKKAVGKRSTAKTSKSPKRAGAKKSAAKKRPAARKASRGKRPTKRRGR
jgi:predicted enzyme related to lactoylglutathione lyase